MTSDAKIGLLLGLVFIFVIAFIINGLPNLRPQPGKAEATPVMNPTTNEDFGIADAARKAQETTASWSDLLGQPQNEPAVARTPTVESAQPPVEMPPAADHPDVRSLLPSIESLLDRFASGMQQKELQPTTVNMDPVKPVVTESAVATAPPTRAELSPAGPAAPAPDIRAAARSVTALERAGWKPCVVQEGETLAAVAKRFYGPEDGNRIANIRRIYEANKDVLKSPDQVVAGQKLLVPPPLPPLAPKPTQPGDVLSQALFEKVDAIGKMGATRTPPPAPEGRWYVVQDGDNLWKIAAGQLGSGTRYEEIAKLNADLLKSKDVLDVGMRIRLPAK
jgi:nucleoid-associated protein YgaU